MAIPSHNGKLSPAAIQDVAQKRSDIHYPKPRVVSLTQATELGGVYLQEEIQDISTTCKALGLNVHMDGARFANACAFLSCSPAEISWKSGVDVLCFGGSKNGMALGEAIVFFNRKLAIDFEYRCKQSGQLASKMRFLSAPWVGLLAEETWRTNAMHANRCAQFLAHLAQAIPGVTLVYPVASNAVFLKLPETVITELRAKGWIFYTFIGGNARFMCSWDTSEDYILRLAHDLKSLMCA